MLVLWLQLSLVLGLHHILERNKHAIPSHFLPHKQQNPMCPRITLVTQWTLNILIFMYFQTILTESPPEANEIRGMSCFAISSLVSNVTNERNLLDTVNVAFVPALYISGVSQIHWITCLSTRRFLDVFKLAASQTRLMHSLQKMLITRINRI